MGHFAALAVLNCQNYFNELQRFQQIKFQPITWQDEQFFYDN
jgi:hypothetical protein